ncbi:microtubule associated protein-domain-containing protein [Cunninghamella echinulata]|nr:microtubule associated protein-domain-containing protein [Cunninghamella echinulata]
MSTQELLKQLDSRFEKLLLLNDEIGTTKTKQKEQLNDLCQAIIDLTDKQIQHVSNERDNLKQQCQQTYQDIVYLKRLMGEYIDDSSMETQPNTCLSKTVNELEAKRDIVKKHYEKRLVDVKELYQRLKEYQITLGDYVNTALIIEKDIDVSLPTVTCLEEEIRRCENEYVNRAQQVDFGTERILQLWKQLGLAPKNDFEYTVDQLYKENQSDKKVYLYAKLVQESQLNRILQTIAQLEDIKQQREFRKQEIEQHLYRLWSKLQTNDVEKDTFLLNNNGISSIELNNYEKELERMLKLKSERVQDFILDARNELENLWNQLYFSREERNSFTVFESDDYNDIILEKHENEIERLKHLVEDRKYILDKVERHMKLLQEIQDFESSTNDPKRLFSKGQRDPGRLLREEKFRKRIARELPKSKRELVGALREFQTSTGAPFTVYGECYLDKLESENNESTGTAATNSVYRRATTPRRSITNSITRAPLTTPHNRLQSKLNFRTPQANRKLNMESENITNTKDEWQKLESQVSSTTSILHRVRQNNIRKRKGTLGNRLTNNNNKSSVAMVAADSFMKTTKGRVSDGTTSSTDSVPSHSSGAHTLVETNFKTNENTVPFTTSSTAKSRKRIARTLSERKAMLFEDDISLDLAIFDDGPELSDMSDNDL